MKFASVFVMLLLVGCVAAPTMEQLETQAFLTGDWSAVEKREHAIERRRLRDGIQCPESYMSYCEISFGRKSCTCVARDAIRVSFYDY